MYVNDLANTVDSVNSERSSSDAHVPIADKDQHGDLDQAPAMLQAPMHCEFW